jgi:hypothetical protein
MQTLNYSLVENTINNIISGLQLMNNQCSKENIFINDLFNKLYKMKEP